MLHLWQGLGYYSRARNLHKCAQVVVTKYAGQFPTSEAELLKLPGIGPYTAAAIAAIAFNRHATVVDGNVERVISRLYQVDTPLPDAKPVIKELAQQLTCAQHPGDYAGAIMDLGATVCTPKKPLCLTCPVRGFCACGNAEQAVQYPKKRAKAARPAKVGTAWAVFDPKGRVYLHQRPSKGLLANLWELPNNGWEKEDRLPPALAYWQRQANARPCGTIKHVFTHFSLQLQVLRLDLPATADDAPGLNQWFNLNALPPLPTLMKKVLSAAQQRD